ncbi:MAG: VanW family protein, partial [Candidatus Symbiothrix sp.]|nr:VanW family protein [Candidatus Symbiothrix sp.]
MKSTQKKVSGADLPTPAHGFIFESAAGKNRICRSVQNLFQPVRRYKSQPIGNDAQQLSESVSPLWSGEETAAMLIAGKIQNLRLAARYMDGIVVPAGQVFSFWKQTGRMTRRRRYALGRELREGCIIPSIGGGICQLSNAIYDAALKAGLEIVERHRHSQVIAGSLAEHDRDATVFWNYIDLRLQAPFPWQLQVHIDDKHLSVRIFAQETQKKPNLPDTQSLPPDAMGDCSRCGRTDCYLYVGDIPLHTHKTWLVTDEEWAEFTLYRKENQTEQDKMLTSSSRYVANFYSRLMRRIHLRLGHPLPVAQNSRYSRITRALIKKLDASDTYLVIPQDLLSWLWMEGELRGRTFDVLMNALPVPELQRR